MNTEVIPRKLVNQLLHLAQASPEAEICGLIGGISNKAAQCYPVANEADDPRRLFALDPQGQIAAMRSMRERGETLYGIYHSHPFSPPFPSAADLAGANYPEALYLIISLQTIGVLEMRGFRLAGGETIEVTLEVER